MTKNINRRDFIKTLGLGAASAATIATGCRTNNKSETVDQKVFGEMTYRMSPNKQEKVSLLGYGCMRWPTIGQGNELQVDQEAVNQLVDYAIEHGVNYFDNAPVYIQGLSEKATGIALGRHPRDKYFVATKLSNMSNDSYQVAVDMYHQSFENLKVDYIDYYLLHSFGDMATFNRRFINNGVMDFILKEREAGRIRNLGFSFHGRSSNFDELVALTDTYHWDFVQIQLNYIDWEGPNDAKHLYEVLEAHDISVVIMEPLLGGRLSSVNDYIVSQMKERRPGDSIASWAFRFAGSPAKVLTVLSGMTYMEHLQDNLLTYSPLEPITSEEHDFLMEVASNYRSLQLIPCNDCKYCMPCPYGIDIPSILLYYNKCVNSGKILLSSVDSNYKAARKEFLIGYDRAVENLRQANHCIGCRKCVEECPQRINIPQQLQKVDAYCENLKQNKEF
ncbi:MAG: twin-arginine translocation signal domain-containing protein [Bacteroidales bacterium]|nr:twin-arginine translocation signal domain-containing protein [Bacteroidales bacterium]